MRIFYSIMLLVLTSAAAAQVPSSLPIWKPEVHEVGDWLIRSPKQKALVSRSANGERVILNNGLLHREFVIKPNVACIDFRNLSNGQQLLRSVKPEAKVVIDGKTYRIGGLHGQPEHGYFLESWLGRMTADNDDFQCFDVGVEELRSRLDWKARTWLPAQTPTGGKVVVFRYRSHSPELADVHVNVRYEIYDGIPLLVKSVHIENKSSRAIAIGRVTNEVLGLVEEESAVVGAPEEMKKQHGLYVETNYAFNNAMRYDISDQTTHWLTDSLYTSQVNYYYQTPCVLEVYPENVRSVDLRPGEIFNSVRTHELLMDSYDRERRGLAIRRMYRVVAPWTAQNPIFMHLVSKTDEQVINAIDQCAATGYEALILSFGSHCNMEDVSPENLARWKKIADYAHSRSILIGSYSLFSSRRISDEDDVISPLTNKPGGAFFGNAPCFGSRWGLEYREKIKTFIAATGLDIWENDGPYPGDVCASTTHPGHRNLHDSQWRQMEIQKELYHWLNERGVYINAPDWYFLDGTHKIALGYREVNFSLPRAQQKILNRQNIYDGLWEKTPSMSWGFVPLTVYQGGGPEAVLEPLHDHRDDYEQLMMQYYGAGVQACYRGPRLYDTDSTKALVQRTISWYKKYRDILNADIIHLRRADGRDWDGIMHVSTTLKQKGFMMLFNPTDMPITRTIKLNVYYTGLNKSVMIREREGRGRRLPVNRDHTVNVEFTLPAGGYSWYVLE